MIINTQEIGERVHQLRTDRHMTLSALSEELNCSRDHISKVENNRRCPSLDMLAELSAYFGVSMDSRLWSEVDRCVCVVSEAGFSCS